MAKSKWDNIKDKLIVIEGWARDGLTNEQIAENLNIGKTTFYKLLKEYPELSEHLKKGKEVVDYEVENALLKNALSGNITAQIFWLKNRKPKQWKDKVEVEDESNKETLDKLDEVLKGLGGVV